MPVLNECMCDVGEWPTLAIFFFFLIDLRTNLNSILSLLKDQGASDLGPILAQGPKKLKQPMSVLNVEWKLDVVNVFV